MEQYRGTTICSVRRGRQVVMGGDGHAVGLRFGQGCVGGDDGNCGGLTQPLAGKGGIVALHRRGAEATG